MSSNAALQARVDVHTPGHVYPIHIGVGLLEAPATWAGLRPGGRVVVVTNDTVAPLYAAPVMGALQAAGQKVSLVALPDGEANKDWVTLQQIFDHLLAQGADRRTVLVALGGGVVGDMTGFAAACYMRGVDFIQVPTTLLSQVDSSVGGKTGINHPLGKNMIGAFHQPLQVVCDLDALRTLPARELSAGLAEVIKYGPIADAAFLDWIEAHLAELRRADTAALVHAVRRSCEIKADVVGQDEKESGLRAILNFGHTFGHAIEAGMGYGEWLHGEAVGCGMGLAADLSCELGLVPASFVSRLKGLIEAVGLPVKPPIWPVAQWMSLMRVDKKAQDGEIRFVVIEAVGRAAVRPVDDALVARVLRRHGATD